MQALLIVALEALPKSVAKPCSVVVGGGVSLTLIVVQVGIKVDIVE